MHMVTINNNTKYDTGHLHISLLAYDEHRHHQYYVMNFKLSLVDANVTFVI